MAPEEVRSEFFAQSAQRPAADLLCLRWRIWSRKVVLVLSSSSLYHAHRSVAHNPG